MSLLLLMLITTAFWVVPADSMDNLKFWNHSKNAKIEANLKEIFEELASNAEKIRNEGAYKILQDFNNGKIEKHSENLMEISNAKAKNLLDQISFAIKNNVIIKSEVNKRWICAKEIPSKMKEALKLIKEKIFKIKIRKDENYSENIKKPFLMILSVAVRICAMIGPKNELQTFLTAYKCSSKDQSKTPPIIYSFGILPIYSNNNIGKLGHSTGEIVAISLNKNISTESKQNFNFLLKLSEIELTPFDILILAKEIEFDLHSNFAGPNIKDIYYLVLDHFYRFGPISEFYKVEFKVEHYCNLVNFMLQLMNRVKESPNLSEYFVNAEFSTELEQKLKKFHQLENEYEHYCKQNYVSNDINEHQDFLHFAEAVHVNWNPYKELLITLKTFKYVYLCSKKRLGYFGRIIESLKLWQDLVNEGQETEEDRELMNIIQSKNYDHFKLDKLMPKLQTLENFKKIQQNYKELMAIERKGTENDDKNAFGLIVTLNDELEKAKTFCIEKI